MKQYIYPSSAVGRSEWPSGTLRLDGIEVTENPLEADLLVLPGSLAMFHNDVNALARLPHVQGRAHQLVAFDVSDYDTTFKGVRDAILIRCNLKKRMLEDHPNSIAWAWPVEDFSDCIAVPEGGFKHDVSFQGWVTSHDTRRISVDAIKNSLLKRDIAAYTDFTGYIYHTAEGLRRRAEFRRSMRESRLALCPESISGVLPYRFFEALSAARVPILVGSDYNLPFADSIPYDEFIIRLDRDQAASAGQKAARYLSQHSDADLIEKGRQGRYYWEKFLHRDKWPQLMAWAVEKKVLACA